MTTILACPITGVMAADTRVTDGQQKWNEPKVQRIGGTLYGTCGDAVEGDLFFAWLRKGRRGKKPQLDKEEFNALALNKGGLFWFDNKLEPHQIDRPMAIGSGASAARSALDALRECEWGGAKPDVARAVEIACEHDAGSGLPVQHYKVGAK
jgi:ATP-dependent protease HslVU (ClpYQ) peptidase subunit